MFLSLACAGFASEQNEKAKRVTCVGDSITAGPYPKMLQDELGSGWVTLNCGRGGATVIEGSYYPYHKQPEYQKALASEPDVVIIMLGTNDANPKWWDDPNRKTSFQGTPHDEFKTRYLALVDSFLKLPTQPRVILATPMPVLGDKKPKEAGRGERLVKEVIPIIEQIAKERNLELVDLQTAMKDQKAHSKDGVHYRDPGYLAMAKYFRDALLKAPAPAEGGEKIHPDPKPAP